MPLVAGLEDQVARPGLDDVIAQQRAYAPLEDEAVVVLARVQVQRRGERPRRHRVLDEREAGGCKAAEYVGEQVDPGRGGGAEMDAAGLEAGDRAEFLFGGAEPGECLGGARGEHVPGVGEAALASAAFGQPLAATRKRKNHRPDVTN